MSGSNTIGLGLGVVILIVLWTVTAFLWVLLSRSQTALRTAVTCLSVILTIGMFLIPTSDDTSSTQQEKKHAVIVIFKIKENVHKTLALFEIILVPRQMVAP